MELGPREKELIGLLCAGCRVCEAAKRMGTTSTAAGQMLAHIRAKCGVRTMFGLALWCVQKGYIR